MSRKVLYPWPLVWLLLILLFGPQQLCALEVPPPKGRINDTAGMLSHNTCDYLNRMLAELERTDSTQVMILTIASLKGDSLEEFSLRVAQKWGIGQKEADNGLLLLIAQNERKIRIEVGYGLEASLTDLRAGRIIGNVIVPEFKKGNFDQGVINGVTAIISTVKGQFQALDLHHGAQPEPFLNYQAVIGFVVCLLLLYVMLKDNFFSMAAASAILVTGAGAVFLDLEIWQILLLIPAGFIVGLLLTLIQRLFRSKSRYAAYRISWDDDNWYNGSSSGGSNFSGGSSGAGSSSGGGSFGGGGASGGW